MHYEEIVFMSRMVRMESVRWAFNTRLWSPNKADWMTALSCIQPEEKERIGKYVFKKDAKSSIAGRLMLRKLVTERFGLSWAHARFCRTEKGRPFLMTAVPDAFKGVDFNVSHQGDWAILAAELGCKVGADVMKMEYIGGKSVDEFFHTMRRQFTPEEWLEIRSYPEEVAQLGSFYRHWCLKEGVVKALGVGIGFELQRVSFQIQTPVLKVSEVTKDTKVKIDGQLDTQWHFEETMLDSLHSVAVALNYGGHKEDISVNAPLYSKLSFDDLISNSEHITAPDEKTAEMFMQKEETPWK